MIQKWKPEDDVQFKIPQMHVVFQLSWVMGVVYKWKKK